MALHIAELYGNCPVQADGTFDGVPFYFRARGEYWSVTLNPFSMTEFTLFRKYYGKWPEAGWMTSEQAMGFIAHTYLFWKASKA